MNAELARSNPQELGGGATRGYWVAQAAEFLRHRFEPAVRAQLEGAFSSDLTSALGGGHLGDWVARAHLIELFDSIAKARGTALDPFEDLLACGEFVEQRTTNQFTDLLMKILTPELFARKLPLFWQRDHGHAGNCVVDTCGPNGVKFHLERVESFCHVAPVWLGWVRAALTTLQVGSLKSSQNGWRRNTPGPERVDFEVSWS